MNFVNLFISPSGRINRAKFWIAVLILALISILFAAMVIISGEGKGAIIANAIVSLLIAASGILIGIKRLHDRNKSGWWILLFYVAPTVMLSIGYVAGTDSLINLLGLLALAIYVWSLVELGCLRGTIGLNKYGPDPLAPEVLTPPVRTHA